MLNLFRYPEDGSDSGPVSRDGLNTEEAIKIMGEDDEKEEEPIKLEADDNKDFEIVDEKEDEDEDDEKKEEKDEEELEDEEPDDEKLELTTPVRRQEILAKYPKLFKDFPYLEKAYYREQQFTEILSTVEDAREAVEKASTLDKFENDIHHGKLEAAVRAVKSSGDEAFNHLVDNYLPNLARVDKDAYHHVVGNVVKMTIVEMLKEARNSNNDELQEAARIVNHFIFGTHTINPPSQLSKQRNGDDEARDEINQERNEILRERFEASKDDLNMKVNNSLKATIAAYIDPKESMTDYVRKNASREAQEELETMLAGDKRLGMVIDRLWGEAIKNKFNRASLDKIRSAYLTRAKTLLPTVIKKARNEALRGLGKRVRNEDDTPKKGPLPAGRSASHERSSGKSYAERAKEIPVGMSSADYLMKD